MNRRAPWCYNRPVFDCIMPAAGASSRMRSPRLRPPESAEGGSSGGEAAFKPLLPFSGSTLVETAASAALGAGCRLLLVVGCRGEEVAEVFEASRYQEARESGRFLFVRNPRWAEGLLGSIQAALPELRGDAFFVSHADMPFLRPEHYATLATARRDLSPGAGETAFVASCEGRRGHPVLLPSAWASAIAALPPGEGLRDYLRRMPRVHVEIGSAALRDIDTPDDYERALL
jgi:CTP:molybdopterin cytidylyltransferase MocA